jgi:hypothetical protein
MIKSRRMGWVKHVVRMGKSRSAYRVSMGKTERNKPLGRARYRWENNIRMDFR